MRQLAIAVTLAGAALVGCAESLDGAGSPGATPAPDAPAITSSESATGAHPAVSFQGVSVAAGDVGTPPQVTSAARDAPPGLLVKDLVVGTGPAAQPESKVTVQYVGVRHRDGAVFDSSWDLGRPIEFGLSGVIRGFSQGIGGAPGVRPMRVGGRRIMVFPAELGYGAGGSGSAIPPNTPLVFVVDLVAVS